VIGHINYHEQHHSSVVAGLIPCILYCLS